MFYRPRNNDHGLPYNPLKACVVPRPIGWISTVNIEGAVNLAPFSFFNMLSYNPPYVLFSSGMHQDSAHKDTVVNIEQTGEFVYNMATWDQREAMNRSAMIVERGVDELAAAELEALPSRFVRPPRVKGAPVHFECRHYQSLDLPGTTPKAAHRVILGEVIGVHIDDGALTADGFLDIAAIRPIGRLGYKDYVTVEETFSMEKATPEEHIRQAAE